MLNYVAALVLNYLIFDSLSYWRDTSATGQVFPQGKPLPDAADWPVSTLGAVGDPARLRPRVRGRGRAVGALLAHPVRVRGAGDRRLAARGALRGDADAPQDRRRDVPLGRDGRNRRREPDGRLSPRARRHGPAAVRTTATRASSSPRSPATTRSPSCLVAFLLGGLQNAGLHAAGRRLPLRARRRDAGDDPVLRARRRAARPLPGQIVRAARAQRGRRRRRPQR